MTKFSIFSTILRFLQCIRTKHSFLRNSNAIMCCNVALSLSDRAYNSYDSSLCRLSTFSPGNSHFKNESSSNETTQLIILLTRVFPFKQCETLPEVIVFSMSSLTFLLREAGMQRHKVSHCILTTFVVQQSVLSVYSNVIFCCYCVAFFSPSNYDALS